MIARWAMVDPFLPMVIKTGKDTAENKVQKMKVFHDDLYEQYRRILHGPSHVIDRMKGLMVNFCQAFKENKKAEKKIKKARTPDQYLAAANHFFEAEAAGIVDNQGVCFRSHFFGTLSSSFLAEALTKKWARDTFHNIDNLKKKAGPY